MAGSGRGNKGVSVIDDPNRPDCPACGSYMKSNGKDWTCTECRKHIRKRRKTAAEPDDFFNIWGFDVGAAESYAKECRQADRIIVTSAQNNTQPEKAFLKSLEVAAEFYNAKLIIIPVHYQTKGLFDKQKEEKYWFSDVSKYLVKGDIEIGNITIRPDVKINATTVNPLSGKHGHCGNRWVVFGHPQHMMEPVASPADQLPKRMYTSGSVTKPNYTVTDAGEKAKFHHVAGALIIENMGDFCFVRNLNADKKGAFYDLERRFTPGGVSKHSGISALTTGDEHVKFNTVVNETYLNKDSIVNVLKPKYIVRHDVLDGYAGSHHHEQDDVLRFKKFHNGDCDYRAELDECVRFIDETTPSWAKTLMVPSNHHDHLDKWLSRVDPKKDPLNALLIHELKHQQYTSVMNGKSVSAFELYCRGRLNCRFEFLDRNKQHLINGVDHSQHGDVGANGSRGSARGLAKSTYKMTIGHSHGARLFQGVAQVGTSTGRLGYERGLSDHSNTHVIQYRNGKRTHIDIINGKWRKDVT